MSDAFYEIFISYARKDNRPIPESYPHGWVTGLCDHIRADHRRFSTEPLRIFFDTHEIKDMDDWRHRILGALRHSKILLVCLSPNYLASPPCRWEWDEYLKRQVHQLMGSDSIASVYLVEVPGSSEQVNAKWLDLVKRGNFTDIRPWYDEGARALQLAEVQKRLAKLGESLWDRIQRARRAEAAPGNLRRQTPFFVGRKQELLDLHNRLGVGAIGVVTAVHGIGGQGKTELAVAYAHAFADCYPAGLWALKAEGKKELLSLIGELAFDPALGYTPTDAEKNDPELLGKGVLNHLKSRADAVRDMDPDKGAAALLLLDNVSEAGLLAPGQIAALPRVNWLRIVSTTRLGPDQLRANPKGLALLEVDSLSADDALELVREHQLNQQFPSSTEESAARELVDELGGFTLAVEQIAVFLGLHPEIAPSEFLAGLRKKGLASADALPAKHADVALQMLTQDKQLALILQATLAKLSEPALTALRFAALLPPDTVPWPWLRELTLARHPELSQHDEGEPDPWLELRRRLAGLRLLTPGDHPEVARVHRLVAAHVKTIANPMREPEAMVREYVAKRAWTIYYDPIAPVSWNLDALLVSVPFLLETRPNRYLLNSAIFLSEKVMTYRGLLAAHALLNATHNVISGLAAADPANAEWQCDLSVSFNMLGDLAVAQGDLPAAARHFTTGLKITECLATADPANAAWQRGLSVSFNKLGDMAVAQGDLPAAARHFTAGLTIRERLAAADPANAEWQRDLSVSFKKLGDMAVAQGDLPAAARHFTAGLKISERLAATGPASAEWQRDLSVSFKKLGGLALAQGDLPAAERHLIAGLKITERLATADPANAAWQRDLSVSISKLGDMSVAQGDLPAAARHYTAGLKITERLAAADPVNAELQRDLSVSLNKLGDLAVDQGDLPAAARHFTAGLKITEHLAAADPANAEWQRDLSVSFQRLGDLAVAQGDLFAAARHFTASLKISECLAAADPANAEWQRDLSVSFSKLGGLAVAQGDLFAAARHFTASLKISECLAAADPANAEWQRDLSVSFSKLGAMAVAQGDLPAAARHFIAGLKITERMATADPANAAWQRDLWVSFWRVAYLMEQQGQPDAGSYWRKACDVLSGMKQAGLFVSAQDESLLANLRAKIGG